MEAGKLDRRIELQARTAKDDGYGNTQGSWATYAVVWAAFLQERGREFLESGAVTDERKAVFRLRWRDDVEASHRIVCGERTYDIHDVRELGRKIGLELHATSTE